MKILVDATGIVREKAGVGVYARNLLDQLTAVAGDFQIFILAQDDDAEMDFSGRAGVTMLKVPARWFRKLPLRLLLEQIYLPLLLWRRGIAVVHSLHYAFPLIRFGTRQVVTIHDMTFFNMPEVHERTKVLYFTRFMRAGARRADHLIFISRSAMEDYVARLGVPCGQATVIPHGKDEGYGPGVPSERVCASREKFNLPGPFVLYVGTIEPRKNLLRLVEAFASVAAEEPTLSLVIAGKLGWMSDDLFATVSRLGLTERIRFPGFISEEDKRSLLVACSAFVYPSLYEGFGLPALEALACGAPTITSNLSSLPEVVGDAALLIDPTDTGQLSEALRRVLTDKPLAEELRARGLQQAAKFTWRRTAEQTAAVYRSLARQPGRERSAR